MKRILIFSLAYYPSNVSGAEVAIKEITDRIPREEIAFDVITLRFEKSAPLVEQIGNAQVYRVVGGPSYVAKTFFPFFAAIKAYRLHRAFHYDGWWAMMSYMLFPIVLLRLFGVRLPYALAIQEGDTFEYMFGRPHIRFLLPLLRIGFKNASVIQTISKYLAGWPKRFGYKGPLEVIPNGFNPSFLTREYPPHELDALKKKLGIKQDEAVLVTVSRLVKKNAVDDCIRALALLSRRTKLLVVGSGPDEAMLKQLALDLKVSEQVIFVGNVDTSETTKYRKISNIFVRPSRSEGMGNSFVSSMALGLPVIATQEGGIADFLFDAKRNPEKQTTGWAVDKDSPEQIAQAVEDILGNPEHTKKVVEVARNLALTKFDWDTIAKDMQNKVFSRLFDKDLAK